MAEHRDERLSGQDESERSIGKRAAIAAGAGLGATVLFAPGAEAATFTVTSLADDGSDGTLRTEIADAVAADGDDTIAFQSGLSGTIQLQGGADPDIEITGDSLDIQGPGASALTVRGAGTDRLFELTNADAADDEVIFSGLTLTNGNGIPSSESGGAIASDIDGGSAFALDVVVNNSVITGNSGQRGGALYSFYAAISVNDSVVSNNQAAQRGGGIYLYAANQDLSEASSLSVVNSRIAGNESGVGGASGDGGGIYNAEPMGGTVIRGSQITGNRADGQGGGIKSYSDNLTANGGGTGGPFTITESTIAGNVASTGYGGGLSLYGPEIKETTIARSTVSGNRADLGGGGMMLWGTGANLVVENTTVSGNVADADNNNPASYAGGIGSYNRDISVPQNADHERVIRNSTIVDNTAPQGGGVRAFLDDGAGPGEDVLKLVSTVVANNTAADGPDIADQDGGTPPDPAIERFDLSFSLIETPEEGVSAVQNPAGSSQLGVDPQLGPLGDNGGPTQTHLPTETSPLLDSGISSGLLVDQRGFPRPFDRPIANRAGSDATDIGAVELLPLCKGLVPTVVSRNGVATGTTGPDIILGTHLKDKISGGGGDDVICAGGGNDKASGGAGKDSVQGEAGKDSLKGNGGKDKLKGNAGKDLLKGGGGKDKLKGGGGKDKLKGGGGKDKLNGGPGNDQETQ